MQQLMRLHHHQEELSKWLKQSPCLNEVIKHSYLDEFIFNIIENDFETV